MVVLISSAHCRARALRNLSVPGEQLSVLQECGAHLAVVLELARVGVVVFPKLPDQLAR